MQQGALLKHHGDAKGIDVLSLHDLTRGVSHCVLTRAVAPLLLSPDLNNVVFKSLVDQRLQERLFAIAIQLDLVVLDSRCRWRDSADVH